MNRIVQAGTKGIMREATGCGWTFDIFWASATEISEAIRCVTETVYMFPFTSTYNPTLPFLLSTTLLPLANKEAQPVAIRTEGNLGPLGEIQHVSWRRMHLLACLILDVEFALDDDLHLVVGVRVHERRALFQAVEAGGDGFVRVVLLAGRLLGMENEGRVRGGLTR